ncbi:MAG TPA: hypothetical protein ENK16_08685, partial [Chromatiales bacterium]|nr:hypothetical protein [Chromatiales bacterium]
MAFLCHSPVSLNTGLTAIAIGEPSAARSVTSLTPPKYLRAGVLLLSILATTTAVHATNEPGPEVDGATLFPSQGDTSTRLDILRDADRYGLNAADYLPGEPGGISPGASVVATARYDRLLDDAYLRFAHDISRGRERARRADSDWHIPVSSTLPADPFANPDQLSPPHPQYVQLQNILQQYQQIKHDGGWEQVSVDHALRTGVREPAVIALRHRLQASGDYTGPVEADPQLFGLALDAAVRHFQTRHGIPATGIVDNRTLRELNVPVSDRIRQIEIAMERWRWLPRDLGRRYLWVNIPAARLELVENGNVSISMRTVVGHPDRPTPSLQAEVSRIVLNPAWVAPPTIVKEDILPRQQRDSGYLARKHIQVFENWAANARELSPDSIDWQSIDPKQIPFRFEQKPGPWNSLGRIKLEMNNDFDIYLHDTNARYLFGLSRRTFSSGCVRLEDAVALSVALLGAESDFDRNALLATIDRGITQNLDLDEPVPVYIVYLTSWVDANSTVNFRPDVYGRDRRV